MSAVENTSKSELLKAKRAAQRATKKAIATEIATIASQANAALEQAAKSLDVPIEDLRAQYLLHTQAHHEVKPTAWNGLVHAMAKKWESEKGELIAGHLARLIVDRKAYRACHRGTPWACVYGICG